MNTKSIAGMVGAAFFGGILAAGMGADEPSGPSFPKYSVYNHGPFTNIIDNSNNTQYVYVNKPNEPSTLLGTIDLTQAGKPELHAVKYTGGK